MRDGILRLFEGKAPSRRSSLPISKSDKIDHDQLDPKLIATFVSPVPQWTRPFPPA